MGIEGLENEDLENARAAASRIFQNFEKRFASFFVELKRIPQKIKPMFLRRKPFPFLCGTDPTKNEAKMEAMRI